jgi:hypothetical protein
MFKPIGKNLLIEIKPDEEKGFIEMDREGNKKKFLLRGIVKDKGELCRDIYNINDVIVFIADQEYMINKNQALLNDEDILGYDR